MNSRPLVSIGMPTYNGAEFIRQALDSLLAQDYDNFELIISDNASRDATPDICAECILKDNRIRYYRNETNLGAVWNFNRVFELSNGEYFMWAADHDLWDPCFLSRCVHVLESDDNVVLVYPLTMLVDSGGSSLELTQDQVDTRGMSPASSFKHLMLRLRTCSMVYGVMRREVLQQTGIFRNIWGSDNALLAELSLRGAIAQLPGVLFYRRRNRPDDVGPEAYKNRMLYALDPITAGEQSRKSIAQLVADLGGVHMQIVADAHLSCPQKTILRLLVRRRFGLPSRSILMLSGIARFIVPERLRPMIGSLFYRGVDLYSRTLVALAVSPDLRKLGSLLSIRVRVWCARAREPIYRICQGFSMRRAHGRERLMDWLRRR